MTQLSLLDFTPVTASPADVPDHSTTMDAPGWYVVGLMRGEIMAGPFTTPDDAAQELDEIDPDCTQYRLACRIAEDITL